MDDKQFEQELESAIKKATTTEGGLTGQANKEDRRDLIAELSSRFIDAYSVEVDKNDFKIQIYENGYYKLFTKEQLTIKLTEIYSILHGDASEVSHWVLAMADQIKSRVCGPYIRFNNGLYNFEDKRMEEFHKDKYTTVAYDFNMIEEPEPEEFLNAMREWFPDETHRQISYKSIYESLLPKKSLKFHQLLGDGGNGKTQFRQMISELIPFYSITTKLDLLVNDTFSSTVLDGHTVVLCSETPDNIDQFDMIKRMTGDDILSIRGMRQAPKQITNMTTLFLDSNQSVNFDDSLSMKDRIHVIPFLNRIRKTDKEVEDFGRKLAQKERKEIICWLLQNEHFCKIEWLKSEDCEHWIKQFGDGVEKFIIYGYDITNDENDSVKGKQLYIEYKRWCKKLGKSDTTRTKFYNALDALDLESEYGLKGTIKYVGLKSKEKIQNTLKSKM